MAVTYPPPQILGMLRAGLLCPNIQLVYVTCGWYFCILGAVVHFVFGAHRTKTEQLNLDI